MCDDKTVPESKKMIENDSKGEAGISYLREMSRCLGEWRRGQVGTAVEAPTNNFIDA